jgi:hypothetical protein
MMVGRSHSGHAARRSDSRQFYLISGCASDLASIASDPFFRELPESPAPRPLGIAELSPIAGSRSKGIPTSRRGEPLPSKSFQSKPQARICSLATSR